MTVPTQRHASAYVHHAAAADRASWSVERDVAWADIDSALARTQPDLLERLRAAALIESFHPVNLARLMRACWDDIDAGVCFSLEAYEGFKHFHALRRYLETVGFEPRITDDELVEVRRGAERREIDPDRVIEALVDFMLSEHLAAHFFHRLAEQAVEPVLAGLLRRIGADEIRHAQGASDLIAKRLAQDPSLASRVLDASTAFTHYGAEVVPDVPVAMPGDDLAIRTFAERIERLSGVRLVDHLKQKL